MINLGNFLEEMQENIEENKSKLTKNQKFFILDHFDESFFQWSLVHSYSILEKFIKTCITNYINEIIQKYEIKKISNSITEIYLKSIYKDKISLNEENIEKLKDYFYHKKYKKYIYQGSNFSEKNLNNLLEKCKIKNLNEDNSDYLEKIYHWRNRIVHSNDIVIKDKNLVIDSKLKLEKIMDELYDHFNDAIKKETYLE